MQDDATHDGSVARAASWWPTVHSALMKDRWIVLLLVVIATLSATAVFQAAKAGDAASAALDAATRLDADGTRLAGHTAALLADDTEVATVLCALDPQSSAAAGALEALLRGPRPITCGSGGADSLSAFQAVSLLHRPPESSATAFDAAAHARDDSHAHGAREILLITGALLLAAGLALLTLVEMSRTERLRPRAITWLFNGPWLPAFTFSACASALAGTVCLLLGSIPDPWALVVIVVVVGLSAVVGWRITRRSRSRPPRTDVTADSEVTRAKWWSEFVGALTIVLVAGIAVAFVLISTKAAELAATAEMLAADADAQYRIAESRLTEEIAILAARRTKPEVDVLQALDLASSTLESSVASRISAVDDERCSVRERVHLVDANAGGEQPANFVDVLVADRLHGPEVCERVADLFRDESSQWSGRLPWLTAALVLVGLTAFFATLGAAHGRPTRVSWMLFATAATGMTAAVVMTAFAVIAATARDQLDDEEFDAVASLLEAEATCPSDYNPIDRSAVLLPSAWVSATVVDVLDVCSREESGPLLLSDLVSPTALADVRDQLASAEGADADASFAAQSRWFELQHAATPSAGARLPFAPPTADSVGRELDIAIPDDVDPLPADGTDGAPSAVRGPPTRYDAAVIAWWTTMFRHALFLALRGAGSDAADAYRDAVACVTGTGSHCAAAAITDPTLRASVLLTALADLQLATGDDAPMLREIVAGAAPQVCITHDDGASTSAHVVHEGSSIWLSDAVPTCSLVVWWYRPTDLDVWRILAEPSLATWTTPYSGMTPLTTGAPLPDGYYRADTWVDGELVATSVSKPENALRRGQE